MLNKVIPCQMQDFALAFVDLSEINIRTFLQPVEGPLNTLVLQCINWSHTHSLPTSTPQAPSIGDVVKLANSIGLNSEQP